MDAQVLVNIVFDWRWCRSRFLFCGNCWTLMSQIPSLANRLKTFWVRWDELHKLQKDAWRSILIQLLWNSFQLKCIKRKKKPVISQKHVEGFSYNICVRFCTDVLWIGFQILSSTVLLWRFQLSEWLWWLKCSNVWHLEVLSVEHGHGSCTYSEAPTLLAPAKKCDFKECYTDSHCCFCSHSWNLL